MADRPEILTARLEEMNHVQQCKEHLGALAQSDRPNDAAMNDVRTETENALHDVEHAGGSVAAVKGVDCPCVRLGASSCLSHGGGG